MKTNIIISVIILLLLAIALFHMYSKSKHNVKYDPATTHPASI